MVTKHGNAWKGGPIECKCKTCGKKIYRKRSQVKPGKNFYCGRPCINKGRSSWNKGKKGYLAGEKHYNWNGGKSRYKHSHRGPYFEWMIGVFNRDNWTCQRCGARSAKGKQVYIEAHHIKPWAKYSSLRYKLSNGITYCLECHCAVDPHRAKFIK